MVPSNWVVVDRLPRTPSGKIDRRALPTIQASASTTREHRVLTPLENQLLVIWEQVLGRDNVSVTDNFFELGGTSLTAVRLFSQLRKVFGRDLPLATLFQAPTVEQLAAFMRSEGKATRWKSLVAIQPEGNNAPLFMVPGVGGNVLEFARLANLLGPNQPLYGTQSRGLDGSEPPLRSIEQMAREYLHEIRELQPNGPYHLGGACMGGIVAFEMAQQLQASGEHVELLALVDTPLARFGNRKRYRLLAVVHPILILTQGAIRHLRNLRDKKLSDWLGSFRVVLGIVKQMVSQRDVYRGDRHVLHQDLVTVANYEAMASYIPREYQGRLHLFVASERAVNPAHYSRLDWGKFAAGGFSVFRINAKDSGELLRSPYVIELAEKIREALARRTSRRGDVPPDAEDYASSSALEHRDLSGSTE
jgi:aspartate racemase